jgi:hypothetical protein
VIHAESRFANLKQCATALGALTLALIALGSAPAGAAFNHEFEDSFPLGPPCAGAKDIAVLDAEEIVYVTCEVVGEGSDVIKRFDFDGNPVDFTAVAPYISGNTLTGDPISYSEKFEYQTWPRIAVDNSSSPSHGKLFVTTTDNVDIFKPSGEIDSALVQPKECIICNGNSLGGIDIGPDGSIYVAAKLVGNRISKYNADRLEQKRIYASVDPEYGENSFLRVDSAGSLWVRHGYYENFFGPQAVDKIEADQFTDELSFGPGTPKSTIEPFTAEFSPFYTSPLLQLVNTTYDVDLTDNDLYVDRGNRIETYSEGNPLEPSYQNAPTFGAGKLTESQAVAVTSDHHVFASNGAEMVRFGHGAVLPDPHTYAPDIDEVGHETAVLHGSVETAGGGPITTCVIEYGPSQGGAFPDSAPCSPNPAATPPGSYFNGTTAVSAELKGLTTGQGYDYRVRAGNAGGSNAGITRTVVPAFVLKTQTLSAEDLTKHSATLRGAFDPDGDVTTYHFEYGLTSVYGSQTSEEPGGSGTGELEVEQSLSSLPSGRTFHYRIVATNVSGTPSGTTFGPDMTFRTASPPDVAGVHATDIDATSATLRATVNPVGYATDYQFEYGPTLDYGQVAPIAKVALGAGEEALPVSQPIEGLQERVTYHFRIVATNKWGSEASSDTTFDFAPPACPNNHVRQQTAGSYLPDCRAYELVSPEAAGGVVLYPGNTVAEGNPGEWTLNRGYAQSPSRFNFFGGQGSIAGLSAPNAIIDTYMSTRTESGWITSVPGLKQAETFDGRRMECSESLELCTDHNDDTFFERELGGGENAPYLFESSGKPLGRLPTNVGSVPGGTRFKGNQRMSGDFSHFVFSSTNVSFAEGGLTEGLGSAYDNDIPTGEVSVISKLPNGTDIPLEGSPPEKGVDFPGLSADGSHVLMQAPSAGGLTHLYLRVDDMVTYDITQGADAEPIGMTRSGDRVLFVTADPLTPDDTDTGSDIYMWTESEVGGPEELTRISKGNGQGDSDTCSANWETSGCGARPLSTERMHPTPSLVSVPGMDDVYAETSGDVYFYSPEVLDGENPGIKNERNLYVYHDGSVQLVATLDAGTQVNRMQISPLGDHAGLVTASRLTSYDNAGRRQMYSYDVDANALRCASCNPSGTPPVSSVRASQGGRFMADDGRVFFSTEEALVSRDTNGDIIDTYEFVNGRPQLISSGQGARDYTGGSEAFTLVTTPQFIGLENVSHDGQDVFFSTYENLLQRDHNGEFVKFYDARSGGGFPEDPQLNRCAAADECHGPDSTPPAFQEVATTGNLGSGGNVKPRASKHRKKHKKKKARRKHVGQRHGGRRDG